MTGIQANECKLYLCAIKDIWSNRIIGYSTDERMKAHVVVSALNDAVARRGNVAGCVLHSDSGSQFRARKLHRTLISHAMLGSKGQVGSGGDADAKQPSAD